MTVYVLQEMGKNIRSAEKFGILKGITIFEETFNLIYILRSADDVLHRTGIQLEELDPININILNTSANGKS